MGITGFLYTEIFDLRLVKLFFKLARRYVYAIGFEVMKDGNVTI